MKLRLSKKKMSDKERYRCAGAKKGGKCSLPVGVSHEYSRVCVTCSLGWGLQMYGRMTVGQHIEIMNLTTKKAVITLYQELAEQNIPKDLRNQLIQMYLDTGIARRPEPVIQVSPSIRPKFCNHRTKVDGQMIQECFTTVNNTGYDLCEEHRQ